MNAQAETEWQNLRHQIEWSEGFWLAFLFTSSPAVAGFLRQRTESFLHAHANSLHVLRPETPEKLAAALGELFTEPATAAGCVWLEVLRVDSFSYDDEAGPWTKAWETFLLRLNERRERLRRHLPGGLLLAAPTSLKPRVRIAAPDLWSIRALVIELPPLSGEVLRPSEHYEATEGTRSGMLVPEPSSRRRIASPILTGDPATQTGVLQKLREAEALLSQEQARRAMALASLAVEELERNCSSEVERDLLARSLATLARAEAKDGDVAAAIEHVRRAIELRVSYPHRSTLPWFGLWIDLAQEKMEDHEQAEEAARSALKLSRELLALQGEDPETRHDVTVALGKLGAVLEESGDLAEARRAYEESLSLRRHLISHYGESPVWLRSIAVSLNSIGQVLEKSGDVAGAREKYEEGVSIFRRLLAEYGESPESLRDLSLGLERLGNVLVGSGDVSGAREAHEEGVRICRRRLSSYGKSPETLRDLSVGLDYLGQALETAGEIDQAAVVFAESVDLARRIVESSGEARFALRDLSQILSRFALFKEKHGDPEGAKALREESSRIQERLRVPT